MNETRRLLLNKEDCVICRMALIFLTTPLLALMLAGAAIASTS